MEYLRKSVNGQWTLHKTKDALIDAAMDNPEDHSASRVLSDYYLEQGRHPGKLMGDPRVGNEPLKQAHPDHEHLGSWEGLHPALRPLLNQTENSTREERQKRIHHMADWLVRGHLPQLLEHHPELQEHADALRNLPPLRTTEDFTKARDTLRNAGEAAWNVGEEHGEFFREHPTMNLSDAAVAADTREGETHGDAWQRRMDARNKFLDDLANHREAAINNSGLKALHDHVNHAFDNGHSQNHNGPIHENYFSDQEAQPVRNAVELAKIAGQHAMEGAAMKHMAGHVNPGEPKELQATVNKAKQSTNKVLKHVLTGKLP